MYTVLISVTHKIFFFSLPKLGLDDSCLESNLCSLRFVPLSVSHFVSPLTIKVAVTRL